MTRLHEMLLERRFVVALLTLLAVVVGLGFAPFAWDLGGLPRDPVPVDAIPNYGEAQQIVATPWPGRSPQDVDDQVTYPLAVQLLGLPGVQHVRSTSMFGLSVVSVIMEDDVDFYWSRSRILEKLASLPPGVLPAGVTPALGPDATALGQVLWYTLEGRTPEGEVAPGWSLEELRSLQDFLVRPALNGVPGVSEVASVGGYVKEYQVDVDPDALRAHGVTLEQVIRAVRESNRDVGAGTLEVNRVEYVVRGVGTVRGLEDLAEVVVDARDGVPLRVRDVATVHFGPAPRRGALDKDGAEAVGGVVVVRHGGNPMEAIGRVKAAIAELAPALPQKTLADGRVSKVTVVPFYDRTGLIAETIGTLEEALIAEILITTLVVVVLLLSLRTAGLVVTVLPLAVLLAFVGMKVLGVEANILALSGIAIAIGTMVDMGIVMTENIVQRLREAPPDAPRAAVVAQAAAEVTGAILTAVATTIVSFLPVFGLQAAEGKLFTPLAWTKTLALAGSALVAVLVLPALATVAWPRVPALPGVEAVRRLRRVGRPVRVAVLVAVIAGTVVLLALHWRPLGLGASDAANVAFVALSSGLLLGGFWLFQAAYPRLLRLCLRHKAAFLVVPGVMLLLGLSTWRGADAVLGWLPERATAGVRARMPGLQGEFMPNLDEGSFLYMPSAMPHASLGATLEAMQAIDRAIAALPEVEHAVGKLGRAETALDPAPVGMIETVVSLAPEWSVDAEGERVRRWREHVRTPEDVWEEIVRVAQTPELTSAPPLQPIETRIVMLQTGMRARIGVKVRGPDLETLEAFGLELEQLLRGVEGVAAATVLADRVVGKPYLEIHPHREAIARYGLRVEDVQRVIEVAIGGMPLTRSIEGRESYAIRVRYPPERRLSPEALDDVLLATPAGAQIPLTEVADVRFVDGPQMIRGEDTFKTLYVTFGAERGRSDTTVVEAARAALDEAVRSGALSVPEGVTWRFAGAWENKVRSDRRLAVLIPLALVLVVVLLYLQFHSLATTLMVFSGVAVAMAGGFLMLWLWGQPWFMDVSFLGHPLREVFGMGPVNLSVAVWVGFIALIGIATDDGVVMATYLDQRFRAAPPTTREEIVASVLEAGRRRIRPCLMTTATTVLALLPVLTSTGRGSDVMIPMAIPAFGGMAFELVTLFVVPVLYAGWQGVLLRLRQRGIVAPAAGTSP